MFGLFAALSNGCQWTDKGEIVEAQDAGASEKLNTISKCVSWSTFTEKTPHYCAKKTWAKTYFKVMQAMADAKSLDPPSLKSEHMAGEQPQRQHHRKY